MKAWTTIGVLALAVVLLSAAPLDASAPIADGGTRLASMRELVADISSEHGVDPRLVHAVIQVESGYNPRAVSRRGALGLMQLMPDTARRLAVHDPLDPAENLRGGVRELARLLAVYHGDLALTLAAYNAGEGAVARYGGVPPYEETTDYVDRIMRLYLGRPYRGGGRHHGAPVRLVRSSDSGGVLITNTGSADTGHQMPRLGRGIAVGGPDGTSSARLSGGFGGSSR